MNNKYLIKIAYTYPTLNKTEFDLAFEGGGNPTRERILNVMTNSDRERYNEAMRGWREDAQYLHPEDVGDHIANMPERDLFSGSTYDDIEGRHRDLAANAGRMVEGPSKVGLGLGYGVGAAGLLGGLALRNPVMAVAGAAAAGITGLYHHESQPEKKYNRFLNRVQDLEKEKSYYVNASREDSGY